MKGKLLWFLKSLFWIVTFYIINKVVELYRITKDVQEFLIAMGDLPRLITQNSSVSIQINDLLCALAITGLLLLIAQSKYKNMQFRDGREYGSACWGTAKDIKPFVDSVFRQNIILTATERLMLSGRAKNPKNNRNKNILVIGGSGSGKTRFFVKPNLMQCHSSYVITDPKGTLIIECGKMLQRQKYKIKTLNLIDFTESMHYNPFAYIHSQKDILRLVNCLIVNTSGGGKEKEDFWVKSERLLYMALIGYIWYEAPDEEKNFPTMLDLLNSCEVREDDEAYQSPVDIIFEELEQQDPKHFAVRQYKKFKLAAGKTAKSILISCAARLAPFELDEVRELMAYDDLELDKLGDRKTALFVIISDTDDTFNFLAAMMYMQMFNQLCTKADKVYKGRLPVHVRCLLDEFANIGEIPKFQRLIATIRSREISVSIILQAQSQLKAIYKDDADTIIGNCETTLFLGGTEKTTLEEMAKLLGKETISLYNQGESRGGQSSDSTNYQKLGRELMTTDELAVMDGGKCICRIRGVRPFFSDKYDIEKHPQYKFLSDFDKRNSFEISSLLYRPAQPIDLNETFELFEAHGAEQT